MTQAFEFYWSPEGRLIHTYVVETLRKAKASFRKDYRTSYAKYMGEVYIKIVLDSAEGTR
jgi:hypothetical protein